MIGDGVWVRLVQRLAYTQQRMLQMFKKELKGRPFVSFFFEIQN